MKKIVVTCDLCEKETDPQRFGVVSGCILKMNDKGEFGPLIFEAHYCEDDISKILGFIEELSKKKNA